MISKISIVSISILLCYLAGSFIAVSFDIRQWDESGRVAYIFAVMALSIIGIGIYNDNKINHGNKNI